MGTQHRIGSVKLCDFGGMEVNEKTTRPRTYSPENYTHRQARFPLTRSRHFSSSHKCMEKTPIFECRIPPHLTTPSQLEDTGYILRSRNWVWSASTWASCHRTLFLLVFFVHFRPNFTSHSLPHTFPLMTIPTMFLPLCYMSFTLTNKQQEHNSIGTTRHRTTRLLGY